MDALLPPSQPSDDGRVDAVALRHLRKRVADKWLVEKHHPDFPRLVLFNYTQRTQVDGKQWDDPWMVQCRGLCILLDENDKSATEDEQEMGGKMVARPFGKFFNYGEHPIREGPYVEKDADFEVFEKKDGSLGIVFWNPLCGKWSVATRGSFVSEQAQHAQQRLESHYASTLEHLDVEYTYLVEIVYRTNQIVVDYGEVDDLFLLGAVHTESGKEIPLEMISFCIEFPRVRRYDALRDFHVVAQWQETEGEGFVVRWRRDGFRLKLKFHEYKRLHQLRAATTPKQIWDALSKCESVETSTVYQRALETVGGGAEGGFRAAFLAKEESIASSDLGKMLADLPDEFHAGFFETVDTMQRQFRTSETQCRSLLALAPSSALPGTRAMADYILSIQSVDADERAALFAMALGRTTQWRSALWRRLKPTGEAAAMPLLRTTRNDRSRSISRDAKDEKNAETQKPTAPSAEK